MSHVGVGIDVSGVEGQGTSVAKLRLLRSLCKVHRNVMVANESGAQPVISAHRRNEFLRNSMVCETDL